MPGLAAAILGFAAFAAGGVTEPQWTYCLAAIAALSVAVRFLRRHAAPAPPLSLGLNWILALPVLYAALQLLPLPAAWIAAVSPERTELNEAAARIGLGMSRVPISASPPLTLAHLLRLLGYLSFFYLGRELTWRFRWRAWLTALPITALASAEAALGLVQHFEGAPAASGTYVNPNHYSCFLQMALPVTLVLAGIAARRARRDRARALGYIAAACVSLSCAVSIFLGSVYSMSRMGLASIAASLPILFALLMWARAGRSGRMAAALAAAALGVFLFVSAPAGLIGRFTAGPRDALTADARLRIWRETLRMSADYRLFGSGLGTYASVFQKYSGAAPLALVDYAHNDYLQLLAELGAVGFAIAAAAGIAILVSMLRAVRRAQGGSARLLAAGSAASIAALLLSSTVDFDFYIPANVLLAAWIAGMGTAAALPEAR